MASGASTGGTSISANVCAEVEKLAGRDSTLEVLPDATPAAVNTAVTGVAAVLARQFVVVEPVVVVALLPTAPMQLRLII